MGMARIESQAVAGYYATPDHLLAPIASMLAFPSVDAPSQVPVHWSLMDPCAGEGKAIHGLSSLWFGQDWYKLASYDRATKGLPYVHVHHLTVEMEKGRSDLLQRAITGIGNHHDNATHMHGDALTLSLDMSADNYSQCQPGVNVLYLNPPYEHDPIHGRMEQAFLEKFAGVPVRGDGMLVYVVPYYALKFGARILSRMYTDIRCYRFPDPDYDAYKQVVLFARRRRFDLVDAVDPEQERTIQGWARSVDGMPVLGQDQGLYPITQYSIGVRGKFRALNLDVVLSKFPARVYGPTGYDMPVSDMVARTFPLGMRPREAHIAAAMGAGVFNGVRIESNDGTFPPLLLKCVFTKDWVKVGEKVKKNKRTGEEVVEVTIEQQQPKLNVVILDLSSSVFLTLAHADIPVGGRDMSKWAIADLIVNYSKALVQAMDTACPALHDGRRPGEAIPIPPTLRTPFAAQKEAIQATLKILFTGESPYGLGEIGSGKTTLATVMLWALSSTHFQTTYQAVCRAERNRAKTLGSLAASFGRVRKNAVRPVKAAIVMMPPHLLKSWEDQIRAVLPGAQVVVLDEPADIERVKAIKDSFGAKTAPVQGHRPGKVQTLSMFDDSPPVGPAPGHGMVIALLTRETAKLGHGYTHGYSSHDRTGQYVFCPRCGAGYTSDATEDAVKRRARCERTTRAPGNVPAHLMAEIGQKGAGLISGGYMSTITGMSRFGHKLKGKSMPTLEHLVRLCTWAQRPDIHKYFSGWDNRQSQNALFTAMVSLAMIIPMSRDGIMNLVRWMVAYAGQDYAAVTQALDLYLCLVAPFVDQDEHAQFADTVLNGYSSTRTNFLSMALSVRASQTGQVLALSGNQPGGNGYENRIKISDGKVLYCGKFAGAKEWAGEAINALGPLATWYFRKCNEFLFQAAGTRRYPLATLISQKFPDLFDFVIGDEFHEYNNDGTAQERAFHRLTGMGKPTMGLSGSLMAGYAKQLFRNLWAMSPKFRGEFAYSDLGRFCKAYGYYKRLVPVEEEGKARKGQIEHGAVTDRATKDMTEEKKLGDAPGFLPVGLIRFVLPMSVTMQKSDMVEALPKVQALVRLVSTDKEQDDQLHTLATGLKKEVQRGRFDRDLSGRLLGALAELPSYLDRAANGPFTIAYPNPMYRRTGKDIMPESGQVIAQVLGLPSDTILPKEQAMLDLLVQELAEGRNVIVFAWHTELIARYERLCTAVGKTATLYADKVPTHKREAWIDKDVVGKRVRILVVNPATVQTGLNNLVHFNSVIWMENPHCDPTITRQANGRVDRIGQVKDVRIWTLVYTDALGLQRKCHDLLMAKVAVAQVVDGLDPVAALSMVGGGSGEQGAMAAMNVGKALFAHLQDMDDD